MVSAEGEVRAVWVGAVLRGPLEHRAEAQVAQGATVVTADWEDLGGQVAWEVSLRRLDFLRAQMVPAVTVEPVVLRV